MRNHAAVLLPCTLIILTLLSCLEPTIIATNSVTPDSSSEASMVKASPTPTTQPACQSMSIVPEGSKLNGRVLVLTVALPPVLRDLRSGQLIEFWHSSELIGSGTLAVSADSSMMAYLQSDPATEPGRFISIVDAMGAELDRIAMADAWRAFKWLDSSHLIVSYEDTDIATTSHLVIDVHGQQLVELPGDYPDVPRPESGSSLVYNSTLTRVMYPVNGDPDAINLVDVRSRTVIAQIPLPGRHQLPAWSPDGTRAAVIAEAGGRSGSTAERHDDLYIITERVAPERVTFFSDGPEPYSEIISFDWSPDGRYIALVVSSSPGSPNSLQEFQLAVLDTEDMGTQQFCNPDDTRSVVGSAWSPDSRYVLIGLVGSAGPTDFLSLALDISSGSAYPIGEFLVGGWLK